MTVQNIELALENRIFCEICEVVLKYKVDDKHLSQDLDYNVHHIRHSELKASLILTAYGIIFGMAYDVSGELPIPEKYTIVFYAIVSILIGLTLASITYSFKTYIPRINQKLKKSVFFSMMLTSTTKRQITIPKS